MEREREREREREKGEREREREREREKERDRETGRNREKEAMTKRERDRKNRKRQEREKLEECNCGCDQKKGKISRKPLSVSIYETDHILDQYLSCFLSYLNLQERKKWMLLVMIRIQDLRKAVVLTDSESSSN